MDEWRETTWGEEISLEYGKGLRGYSNATGPYRVFGSNGPVGWTSDALAPGPGIILGRKGAYRGVRFSKEPFFVIDTAYYVVPKSGLDMRWLYYAIIHHKLGEIDDGSPVPSTTRSAVYVRNLSVPSPTEQKAIATALGALDDKIDLNRCMNETLQAIARAIFKDWFVDFGPTRAKMDGRAPYLAPKIWALFPSRLDDKGKPQGWHTSPIKNSCSRIANGGTPKRGAPEYWNGGTVPWLTSSEVRKPFLIETDGYITETGMAASSAKWVDPDATVVALYGATAGQVSYVATPLTTNQAVCALTPKPNFRYFNYLWLSASTQTLAGMAIGSAQQNLSKGIVEELPTTYSDLDIMKHFDATLDPCFKRIIANETENATLSAIRDLLLPKLMSGEIRLKDAKKVVEAAL